MADGRVDAVLPPRRFGELRRLPSLSVVVVAGVDLAALQRCLDGLLTQDFDRELYEIVVVDPQDRPELREQISGIARQAAGAPPVQYLVVDGGEGLAAARNRGWMYSRGAVLAFIDADAVPVKHWITSGMAALKPGVAAVQGRVRIALPPNPDAQEREIAELAQRGLIGSNCFVGRLGMIAVGGFDERFSAAWRSDTDLQFMLIEYFRDRQRVRPAPLAEVLLGPRPEPWHASLGRQRWHQFDVLLKRKHPVLYRERIGGWATDIHHVVQIAAALLLVLAAGSLLLANAVLAGTALLLWSLLTAGLCVERLHGGSGARRLRVGDLAALALTWMAIPPLALFWRCVGTLRFRVTPTPRLS